MLWWLVCWTKQLNSLHSQINFHVIRHSEYVKTLNFHKSPLQSIQLLNNSIINSLRTEVKKKTPRCIENIHFISIQAIRIQFDKLKCLRFDGEFAYFTGKIWAQGFFYWLDKQARADMLFALLHCLQNASVTHIFSTILFFYSTFFVCFFLSILILFYFIGWSNCCVNTINMYITQTYRARDSNTKWILIACQYKLYKSV